jgi:hypothetical protein
LDYEALDGTVGDAAFVSIASLKRELQWVHSRNDPHQKLNPTHKQNWTNRMRRLKKAAAAVKVTITKSSSADQNTNYGSKVVMWFSKNWAISLVFSQLLGSKCLNNKDFIGK